MNNMNPPHVLIARNSRSGNAALSSPIETHAAAAGIFRSAANTTTTTGAVGSPPWMLEELSLEDADEVELEYSDAGDSIIEVDDTFREHARFPGTVKIVVEGTTFWAHKEVLYFSSPFFEAILSGPAWAETSGRPVSVSSVITISQPPKIPGDHGDSIPEMTITPVDEECGQAHESDGTTTDDSSHEDRSQAIAGSLNKLQGCDSSTLVETETSSSPRPSLSDDSGASASDSSASPSPVRERKPSLEVPKPSPNIKRKHKKFKGSPDAVIILKEERAQTFQDFLKYVYPNLECTISWANVEGLMNIAHKLCVASLQHDCMEFLLTHAAGRPVKALRLAELFQEEELYREASRFVLDNPEGWPEEEMSTLSRETQLKLEKRRTWFLERLLKLGLTQIGKEYQCAPTCPDPPVCARLLEDKWRQAYHACFRFGPCQPSMAYRYLRTLEGINPPLSLVHLNCQTTARAFVSTLFDRMFSLGVRGSGTDTAPPGGANSRVATTTTPGSRRQFMYCTLRDTPKDKKEKPSRNIPPNTNGPA